MSVCADEIIQTIVDGIQIFRWNFEWIAAAIRKRTVGMIRVVRPWPWPCVSSLIGLAAKILKESSINIGICETFLFSLYHEYLMW